MTAYGRAPREYLFLVELVTMKYSCRAYPHIWPHFSPSGIVAHSDYAPFICVQQVTAIMRPPGNILYIIQGEMSILLTAMRRGPRWSGYSAQVGQVRL